MSIPEEKINLLNSPFRCLGIFAYICVLYVWDGFLYLRSSKRILLAALIVIEHFLVLEFTPGIHQTHLAEIKESIFIGIYWIILGVLSSVGLGTGLHTFVLYLGPFIAEVTLASFKCNSVSFDKYGINSFRCPYGSQEDLPPALLSVVGKVQFEAFMWGLGTALGELPPYFIARAARLAGSRAEELEELELEKKTDSSNASLNNFITHVKLIMTSLLRRFGFFGIVAFSSFPNPLFDLAGLSCGHLLVPFWTFFGATFIGKAIIKAHLQAIFVVIMFSKELLEFWLGLIERTLPIVRPLLEEFLEKEQIKFRRAAGKEVLLEQKSLLARIWDFFLICMILYFVISIINSSVQYHLNQQKKSSRKHPIA